MTQAVAEKKGGELKDDPRLKLINAAIKKNKAQPDALIQVLHVAQNMYGYLPMDVVRHVTHALRLPPSRVYGVITFYHFFNLKKQGDHTCMVCTGTACYVKGAQAVLDAIADKFGIRPGEVTPDETLGLQTARCLGACGLAPAVVIDDRVLGKVEPGQMEKELTFKAGESA